MDRSADCHEQLAKETNDPTARLDELNRELREEIARLKGANEALARENHDWVRIFNASTNLVMIVDDQHAILRANKAMTDVLGMTEEEVIGRTCFELVHESKEPPPFCPHSRLLVNGTEQSVEVYEPRLGGVYEVKVFPLLSQDGQRLRSVHVARDVSAQRSTEEKIRQQSEFLNNILNSLSHPFYVIDASDHTIVVANETASASAIAVGQKCYSATYGRTDPCSGPEHPCPVIEVKKTGKPVTVEHTHFHEDGGARNIEVHAHPIMNADGEVVQVIEYTLDITERKRAEEALERRVIALTRPLDDTAGVAFEDLFNFDEIQKLSDQFAKAVGVASLITRPDGTPITKPSNFCRLCSEIVRKTEQGRMNCKHSDSVMGKLDPDGPTVQSCLSVGLCNAGSSITVGGRHIANWMIGQVRNETQDPDAVRAYARTIGADEEEFMEAFHEVPFMSQEQFASVAQALFTLAAQLSTVAYQNVQQARFIAERKKAEEALKESEERLRLFIAHAPTALAMFDSEMRYLAVSRRWMTDYRLGDRDIIGCSHYEVFPKIPERWKTVHRRALEGEVVRADEDCLAPKHRAARWLRWEVRPWYTAEGGIGGVVIFTEDITERKQAEEALRQSEQRFSLAIEGSRVGVVDWDVPNGKMFWSPRVFTLLGYEPDEFEPTFSLVVEKFIHPEDRNYLLQRVLAHHDLHQPAEAECRVIAKDGTVHWLRLSGQSSWDEEGRPVRTVGTVENITERKQAEEARARSEKTYSSLFAESRDGICFVLREGEITDANPAFCEILRYEREELIGKDIKELYVDPAGRYQFLHEIGKNGFLQDYEITLRKKDGTEVECLVTASVQSGDDGSVVGYRAIVRDLTIRKRLQNQLFQAQKMEAIGTLAGGIAHDFNNLLQVVLGYTDMLIMKKAEGSPDLRSLETVRKAAKDGGELVKGLLTFSRQVESAKVPVDLGQHVEHFSTLLRRIIPKTIETELLVSQDVATVSADPIQLDQVLMNLAINAHHAMPDGGKLTIEVRNVTLDEDYCRLNVEAKHGEHVVLNVSDTGHGMEKKVVDHIFEPFFTTKEPGAGTGLGLAIVYGIVKNHDGHITCSSQPGQGTTFSIYFPVAPRQHELDMATTAGEMAAFGTETILLVDDEGPIRKAVAHILTHSGYEVFEAGNGNEALEICQEKQDEIDLVILDINMPGMDGSQCLQAILHINPGMRVIVASGYAAAGWKKRTLELGARGFIGKPFRGQDLLRLVRKVLDERTSLASRLGSSGPMAEPSAAVEEASAADGSPFVEAFQAHGALDVVELPTRLRILAIDDRATYLKMLEAGLAQFGQTVVTASSGGEGLQVFQETPVDVVISDLGMPELDGWEVGRRIKEICQARDVAKTPFILATGEVDLDEADPATSEKMTACGVDDIVRKPMDIPDLMEVIRRLTGRRHSSKY